MEYEKINHSNEPRYLSNEERDFTRRIIVNFFKENSEEIEVFLKETKFPQKRIIELTGFEHYKHEFEKDQIDKNILYAGCLIILLNMDFDSAIDYVRHMKERKEGFEHNKIYKDWKKEVYTTSAVKELEELIQRASDEMDEHDRTEFSGSDKKFLEAQANFNLYNSKLEELNKLAKFEKIKSFIEEYNKSLENDRTRK